MLMAVVVSNAGVGVDQACAQNCDPVELARLLADDGATSDQFGFSVSLSGDTALIGAFKDDDNGTDSGSAYVFTRSGSAWILQAKLIASDRAWNDRFGTSVSLSGDTALIGAWEDDDNGSQTGSAYVFDLNCQSCPADLNGDGVANTQDFLLFLGAWSIRDPLADWNGDGIVNTQDFLAYLNDWVVGC